MSRRGGRGRGSRSRPNRLVLRRTTVVVPGPDGLEDQRVDMLTCGHIIPSNGKDQRRRHCAPCRSNLPPDFDPTTEQETTR